MLQEPSLVEDLIKKKKFEEDYDVLHELGRGRFAVVKKCVCKKSGQTFAAKCIKKSRTNTQGRSGRQQLLLEIDILNQSNHPKLVRLFDVYETRTEMQLILELAAGGDLHRHCIEGDVQRTEKEISYLIRQITEAIRYLHDLSIVHLDLKPDNILLAKECEIFPEIRLIDFGLSRRLNVPYSQFDIVGTPEYVAPEVLAYEPIDYGSDMWSIGVVTYVLLTGISPFAGDDVMETYANIGMVDYDFDCEEFDDISDSAIDFIEKLLVRSPKKRMTAREALEHEWLKQLDGGITAEDVVHATLAQQAPMNENNIVADTPLVEDNYSSSSDSENLLEKSTEQLEKTENEVSNESNATPVESKHETVEQPSSEVPIVKENEKNEKSPESDVEIDNEKLAKEEEKEIKVEKNNIEKSTETDKLKDTLNHTQNDIKHETPKSPSSSKDNSGDSSMKKEGPHKKPEAQQEERKETPHHKKSEKFSLFAKKFEKPETNNNKKETPTKFHKTNDDSSKSKSLAAKFESKTTPQCETKRHETPKAKLPLFGKSKSEDNTTSNTALQSPKEGENKLSSVEQKKLALKMKLKEDNDKGLKPHPAKSAPTTPISIGTPSPIGSTKSSRSNSPAEFRKADGIKNDELSSKNGKQSSPSVKRTTSPNLKVGKDDEKHSDKASPKVNRTSIRGKIPGGIAAKMANKFSSASNSNNSSPKQKSKFEKSNSTEDKSTSKDEKLSDNKADTHESKTSETTDQSGYKKKLDAPSTEKNDSKPAKDIVFSMTLGGGSLSPTGKKLQVGPLMSCASKENDGNAKEEENSVNDTVGENHSEITEIDIDEDRDQVPLKMKMGAGNSIKLGIGKPSTRRSSDLPQLSSEEEKKPKMKDLRGKSQSLSRRRSSTIEGSPNSPRKNYRRLYVKKVRNSKIFDPEFSIDSSAAAQIMQRVDNDVLKVEVRLKSTDLKLLP